MNEGLAATYRMTAEEAELLDLVQKMLDAIHTGDAEEYRALCALDLSCYETDVVPYRIDVLQFHLDMIATSKRSGAYDDLVRCDLLNPRVQLYGDFGIVTYTRLLTFSVAVPAFRTFNETRVFARLGGAWRMVHFHRS